MTEDSKYIIVPDDPLSKKGDEVAAAVKGGFIIKSKMSTKTNIHYVLIKYKKPEYPDDRKVA